MYTTKYHWIGCQDYNTIFELYHILSDLPDQSDIDLHAQLLDLNSESSYRYSPPESIINVCQLLHHGATSMLVFQLFYLAILTSLVM